MAKRMFPKSQQLIEDLLLEILTEEEKPMYPLRHTPNFKVILQVGDFILIEDVGPWTEVPTITNQPEVVVEILTSSGKLQRHQRLFYIDSERTFGEMLFSFEHGFSNFALAEDKVAKTCLGAWNQIEKHTKKGSG